MSISYRGLGAWSEKKLAEECYIKYVVAENDSERHLVIADGSRRIPSHADLVPEDTKLIGAGIANKVYGGDIKVRWGSDTCFDKFGYDKPADSNEAEQVLIEVKSSIGNWIKEVLNK